MSRVFVIILTLYFQTGLAQSCNAIPKCQEPADREWLDGIFCQSVFSSGGFVLQVNCSWLPHISESRSYTLHVIQGNNIPVCKNFTTNKTFKLVPGHKLKKKQVNTVWVSTWISNETCEKTNIFSIIPNVICEAPEIEYAAQTSNLLSIKLNRSGQIRYKETGSDHWDTINATSLNRSLAKTSAPLSFVVQQRCLNENCFHCKWTQEKKIPHKLTEVPNMMITTEKLSSGKQRLTIEWKYTMHSYVDGYTVTVQRIPNSCDSGITFKTNTTKCQFNLSITFFEVSVTAYNEAGISPSASDVVHPLTAPEFPGNIFATYKNGSIFLTWSPLFHDDFCVIGWGTQYTQMKNDIHMGKTENFSIPGPFENLKRYTIMILLYDSKRCMDPRDETTFGITYLYIEEGVPRSGPHNVTVKNVTKNSAVVEWEEIPEEDCQGFLLYYKVYCTDTSRNITEEMTINSSSLNIYHIEELTRSHEYEIKVSGVTSKGEGPPSTPFVFRTLYYADDEFQIIILLTSTGLMITAVTAVSLCAYILHRTKKRYFPKIPNPKHSYLGKISEETATQMKLVQLGPSQEEDRSWGNMDMEVIEKVPTEDMPTDLETQPNWSHTASHYRCQWAPPVQTSTPQGYTKTTPMLKIHRTATESAASAN